MPTTVSTSLAVGAVAAAVLVLLFTTGRTSRGTIAAAALCGAVLAGVSGCGSAIQSVTGGGSPAPAVVQQQDPPVR